MTVGGNPEEIHALARTLRRWSADVDIAAGRVRAGDGVQWVGTAAQRYRKRLADHAKAVDAARDELRDAAKVLTELADELTERQAAIRRAAKAVEDTVDEAKNTLGRLWGVAQDDLTQVERAAGDAAQQVLTTVGSKLPDHGALGWIELGLRLGRVTL